MWAVKIALQSRLSTQGFGTLMAYISGLKHVELAWYELHSLLSMGLEIFLERSAVMLEDYLDRNDCHLIRGRTIRIASVAFVHIKTCNLSNCREYKGTAD